MKKIRYFSVW